MDIQGLQKMTLLDFPGHVACTVFLGGCDLRCPFCHNADLVRGSFPSSVSEDEFFSFLDSRKGLLDGIAITGGEPCLRKDLIDFISRINFEGFKVKLDTNGTHPNLLEQLIKEELLNYVAMDIKNSEEKYAMTSGLDRIDIDAIYQSIDILKNSNINYEFRTTVVHELHKAEDFEKIGNMIEGANNYYLQSFEYNDSIFDTSLSSPTKEEMLLFREIAAKYVAVAEIRGIS